MYAPKAPNRGVAGQADPAIRLRKKEWREVTLLTVYWDDFMPFMGSIVVCCPVGFHPGQHTYLSYS